MNQILIFIHIENLTKEQYSGQYRRKLPYLSASRDSLNPALNLETLQARLFVMEHYKYLHGVEHAHWPHYVMKNVGGHMWKYKFNYAIKAFFLYQVYREVKNYNYVKSVSFLSEDQMLAHYFNIGWSAVMTTGVCLLIWLGKERSLKGITRERDESISMLVLMVATSCCDI